MSNSRQDGPSPQELLSSYAVSAGLSARIKPFPSVDAEGLGAALGQARFLMAPMAGVSDAAYRMMARAGGAALAYSEMVSVAGIHYGGDKTWELVLPQDPEPDIAVQLFGSKPEQFKEAAYQVAGRLGSRLALIDINMACPVPKVTRKGEGSALLDDPERAMQIVRNTRAGLEEAGSGVAVSCKIRRGRREGEHDQAPTFAQALESAGAAAIAVHGRYASQLYRGKADWEAVRRVAEAVSIATIASGDILDAASAVAVLEQTGAVAAMIARGSYGNPWIFADARSLLSGTASAAHGTAERLSALECHLRLLAATGAHLARGRSLCGWYLKGMPEASRWRDRAMHCVTLDDYLELLAAVRQSLSVSS